MSRRFNANHMAASKWITLRLSLTIGGLEKIRLLSGMLNELRREPDFRTFVSKQTNRVPGFMIESVKKDLGPFWHWLPNKSLSYYPNVISNK
ncbi:MAG: radical protein, partial [Bacteroidetes bacterium]|nr:radical protein [Bacteroidota bacterium]